jgi:type I restriction enzyme, S subunit
MSEWKDYKISELGKVVTGKTPSSKNPEEWGTLVAFVTPTDFDSYNKSIEGSIRYLSERGAHVFNSKLLPPNSVIVTCIGSQMGKVALNKIPCVTNQQINSIILNENFNSDFIFYLISSMQGYLRNLATGGSTMPIVNKSDFENIKIVAPDLPTQTAIAEILSSLDDKIELNNKINQELENLAQTLFKQWFIDFEFPNENGEPYKSSGGEMVDSELGEIPEGWNVKTLDDISNITIGRTPPRNEHQWFSTDINDVKWISIRDMGNCGTYIHTTSEYLTEDAVSRFNVPVINSNTVIISFKLTVGRISITTERMLSNEAIAHLNLNNKEIYPEFLYLFLKQFNFDSLGSTSSIATAVNSKSIKSLPFINPNKEVLSKFNEVIVSLFSRIHSLTFENKEIVNLRDTLLPKLITGELEINEISK